MAFAAEIQGASSGASPSWTSSACVQRSPTRRKVRRIPCVERTIRSSPSEKRQPGTLVILDRFPGSRLLRLALGQLHPEVRLDEAVEVAVEHGAGVADLVVGPQVL